jgi:hypothetical protein
MSKLRQSPYFLQQGNPIKIKVAAHNLVGWSDWSTISNSVDGVALMEDVPHKPLASP